MLKGKRRLNGKERLLIRNHPIVSEQISSRLLINLGQTEKKEILEGILYHHERWNGTGYPFGLKGEEIPLFGRILCVADVVAALTEWRPYRDWKMTPDQVLDYEMLRAMDYLLGKEPAHFFDADIVKTLFKAIGRNWGLIAKAMATG